MLIDRPQGQEAWDRLPSNGHYHLNPRLDPSLDRYTGGDIGNGEAVGEHHHSGRLKSMLSGVGRNLRSKQQKRSRSVGADVHQSVRSGAPIGKHEALSGGGGGYDAPSGYGAQYPASHIGHNGGGLRMSSSKTMCGGFSTPNPKAMASYNCRQEIDANFLAFAQRVGDGNESLGVTQLHKSVPNSRTRR